MPETHRADRTKDLILATAERLYAQHGVTAVSNRQIGEAAGQGNNTAVGYHFGTRADLARAILRRHSGEIEAIRARLIDRCAGSEDLRDWVDCLVRPFTDHLAELGSPTWYARCAAQVMTDPALCRLVIDDALTAPAVRAAVEGMNRCLPGLPAPVRAERNDMARNLIVHMSAERERALADGTAVARPTWDATATGLTDAIVGLLRAPVTRA